VTWGRFLGKIWTGDLHGIHIDMPSKVGAMP